MRKPKQFKALKILPLLWSLAFAVLDTTIEITGQADVTLSTGAITSVAEDVASVVDTDILTKFAATADGDVTQ